ncbi:MAG: DUF2207 domain-containing protein [Patescibacteria group bacterium]|nr:MAG: DUF2207 domain-containing protein [Patescibacteria group bacterium]
MKRLLAALAIIGLFPFASANAQAAWSMESFDVDLTVRQDGVLEVRETIVADFLTARHGIYRYVPYQGYDDQGKKYVLDVKLQGVMLDGLVAKASSSRRDGNVVWKIGDPDATIAGRHTYVLSYLVEGAIGRYESFDELYWNATGFGWDVPLPAATVSVKLPDGVEPTQSACYTGDYGSAEQYCEIETFAGETRVRSSYSGEALTVAVGFPKGAVAEPPFWKRVLAWLRMYAVWFLPLAVLAFAYRAWRRHGADAPLGTIVAQYEPPAGLSPAETRALLSQSAQAKDLTSTIIDLAARGHLAIQESEKKGILRTSKEYALVSAKEPVVDASLKDFERTLLAALFDGQAGRNVPISSLRKTFHTHVQEFVKGVTVSLTTQGYFVGDPGRVRAIWMGIGGAFIIAGFFALAFAAPLMISGGILMVFGWFMPKWSPKGLEAARHASGYKEFISKVEKYRAPWMEDQNVFFRALPYAIAFGLGAKWAKAFAHLQMQPPNWYHGANMAAWSSVDFEKNLQGWTTSMMVAAVPSSRSGSGGGGFSGGGFGGGGGGSW